MTSRSLLDLRRSLPTRSTMQREGITPWVLETLTFTASTTGSGTLSFLADGHPDGEPSFVLLDGVSVSAVPTSSTPEPSSLILLRISSRRRCWCTAPQARSLSESA